MVEGGARVRQSSCRGAAPSPSTHHALRPPCRHPTHPSHRSSSCSCSSPGFTSTPPRCPSGWPGVSTGCGSMLTNQSIAGRETACPAFLKLCRALSLPFAPASAHAHASRPCSPRPHSSPVKYVSHLYYGLQGLALNDFTGRTGWACPVGSPQPCSVSGDDILKQLGFYGDSLGFAFMGLLLLTVNGWAGGAGGRCGVSVGSGRAPPLPLPRPLPAFPLLTPPPSSTTLSANSWASTCWDTWHCASRSRATCRSQWRPPRRRCEAAPAPSMSHTHDTSHPTKSSSSHDISLLLFCFISFSNLPGCPQSNESYSFPARFPSSPVDLN